MIILVSFMVFLWIILVLALTVYSFIDVGKPREPGRIYPTPKWLNTLMLWVFMLEFVAIMVYVLCLFVQAFR